MARISLTDFVDIVSKSGTPKTTKVLNVISRDSYHPSKDYYKQLREQIIEMHKENRQKNYLRDVLNKPIAKNKKIHYKQLIEAYLSWLGKKEIQYFDPSNYTLDYDKIQIAINPELGLNINDTKYTIKLYFKSDPLSKNKADIILELMKNYLYDTRHNDTNMSILDIREKKLFTPTREIKHINNTVKAELNYILTFIE